jgi:hypothetical protein
VRPLLDRLHPLDPAPPAARIDALAAAIGRPLIAGGKAISFSSAPMHDTGYEARIAASGCVATRDGNWHDTFNALVWLGFPQVKAAMNRRHCEQMPCTPAGPSTRGPVRDALTQFDEDGLVIVSDSPLLLDALRNHRWREALWERRAEVEAARLFVFGHALMDKARQPHVGLCAKVRYVEGRELGMAAADTDDRYIDGWLAAEIAGGRWPHSPRDLHPLPVLGLPGMTPDNTCAAYFDDVRQFRPAQPGRERA